MRFALDVSKAHSRDGLGSYIRGLVRGLADLEPRADRLLLVNLLGETDARTLEAALGTLPAGFELDLDPWPRQSPERQAATLDGVDALLATAWRVPAAAPPSLFVVYDLTFWTHAGHHTLSNRLHCAEGVLRARLRGDAFAAISEESARELRRLLGAGEKGAGEITIAPPAAAGAFRPAEGDVLARVRARHGLGPVDGFVLSVGSLEPRKNLGRLIDAHGRLDAELQERYPLLLAGGSGWRNADVEARLEAVDPARVRRLGSLAEDELVDLFGAATVFVYPSLAEGFGLPVLEAMACGAAVITSNLSSLPEVAGSAARLLDPRDVGALAAALDALLRDPDARQVLAAEGLERATHFSWTRTAEILLARLRSLPHRSEDAPWL